MFCRGKIIIIKGAGTRAHTHVQVGLYKILFYFEALLVLVIFFANHLLYCAIHCTILLLIAAPRTQF